MLWRRKALLKVTATVFRSQLWHFLRYCKKSFFPCWPKHLYSWKAGNQVDVSTISHKGIPQMPNWFTPLFAHSICMAFLLSYRQRPLQAHQGCQAGGWDGRRRDDQDHLADDQGQAHLPLPGRGVRVLRPRPPPSRRHRRPGNNNTHALWGGWERGCRCKADFPLLSQRPSAGHPIKKFKLSKAPPPSLSWQKTWKNFKNFIYNFVFSFFKNSTIILHVLGSTKKYRILKKWSEIEISPAKQKKS